jgi:hypothetical protein
MHPGATLQNLDYAKFNHHPILLDTEAQQFSSSKGEWLQESGFHDIVLHAWEKAKAADPSAGVLAKLNAMHVDLHAWDSSYLKKPKKRLRQEQRELEWVVAG